jgi:TetR/AcrR family transcriptional regulator
MGVSSRREREKQERRTAILQAAKELFYEKGFQATTMDDIAERAEHGKGTIYNYFKSKDDLYVSIIEEGFFELRRRLMESVKRKRGVENKVRAIYFAYIDHNLENREYFRITLHFMNEDAMENISEELLSKLNDIALEMLNFSADIVREGLDSGLLRQDIDPLSLCLIGWRLATGMLELTLLGGVGTMIDTGRALFEDAIDVLLDGSMRRGGEGNE